jgi:hypothetical protein
LAHILWIDKGFRGLTNCAYRDRLTIG